jgi:hypothetical protein
VCVSVWKGEGGHRMIRPEVELGMLLGTASLNGPSPRPERGPRAGREPRGVGGCEVSGCPTAGAGQLGTPPIFILGPCTVYTPREQRHGDFRKFASRLGAGTELGPLSSRTDITCSAARALCATEDSWRGK